MSMQPLTIAMLSIHSSPIGELGTRDTGGMSVYVRELARELASWVGGYISNKNYGQGFASALEVMDTRAGDCTEHSVLLTALLRAAGISARPAVGVVYHEGSFLGHMWTEVYVDYWRTLDALDPDTLPIRIRVAAS